MATKIESLIDDEPIPRQGWVLLSFLSPEGIKNCALRGLKVRGVFESRAEAEDYAKKLRDNDPNFDIHVGEVGKWLPWDPDPSSYKEVNHPNEKLNELMNARNEQLEKAKLMQQQIKSDKLKEANQENPQEHESRKEKIQSRLKKKFEEKQQSSKDKVEPMNSEEKPEEKLEETSENKPEETQKSNMTVQEKLDKLKQLYAKYKSK